MSIGSPPATGRLDDPRFDIYIIIELDLMPQQVRYYSTEDRFKKWTRSIIEMLQADKGFSIRGSCIDFPSLHLYD